MENKLSAEGDHTGARTKTLIAGAAIGAVVGLAGAYLLLRNLEKEDGELSISTGEGIRLGVLVLGLLRQIASLHE
jgi:hypothetical protein